jgi:Superfamily II DNA/RNA helicases, SNF2 family
VPEQSDVATALESHGSLADPDFAISIAGWLDGSGQTVEPTGLTGAILKTRDGPRLLPETTWHLLCRIRQFAQRPDSQRNDQAHRRAWGHIRQAALAANARLDAFLYRTVVLTPERLQLGLRRNDVGGTKMVEVVPSFASCPDGWLDRFDTLSSVQDRYDLPTHEGIVQVLITPQVKTVLEQIKQWPGRRVAGTRAEAFVSNPFAALGEDASAVIDADQFEQARADANLLSERFIAHIKPDALGYPLEVGLLIESADKATTLPPSNIRLFESDDELAGFIELAQRKLDQGFQLCLWEGYEFELLGDTQTQLDLLRKALEARRQPRALISYAQIYDLSAYSSRVEDIGADKPYYSPFIAKKKDDEGWFPENLVPVISWIPEGESEAIAVPITEEAKQQIRIKLNEAKKAEHDSIHLPSFPKPLPVREAERILEAFDTASERAKQGNFDPTKPTPTGPRPNRPSLVIKANIQGIDYEEARRDILSVVPAEPEVPSSLKPEASLLAHQKYGLAWLQHLYLKSPHTCRGAVLADDMGLGKTLQLLSLMAWAFEKSPGVDPALVVAPVSLLENWKEEIERFFKEDQLPILTVYGDTLSSLRLPRASIDQQLQQEGLVKFLKPNWRQGSRIVLTTYETLRDLEFSFAAEKWSIMVCDEAQKIKNPNAMVTRAAKKQNVRFKIACTGTPVENTLADLWCLFDFVQPGMLGALNEFSCRYRKPIEAETDEEKARVEELRSKIKPQILRRTKKDLANDLPQKITVPDCRHIPLSGHQRALYAQAIELFCKRHEPGAMVPFKNHLGLLHYLRLICTDPRRYGLDAFKPDPLPDYRQRAPKLDWLMSKLATIRERREKVIVFCEFRGIQRLLRHYIEEVFGFAPDIINGDTAASASHSLSRQKRITAFQKKPGFGVVILSPVAVGFGVNIQAANHVIHYTRTWNPAKEDQATDRAYRIGQTKDVFVYYPVVRADDFTTFDVKLDQLLQRKRTLAEAC